MTLYSLAKEKCKCTNIKTVGYVPLYSNNIENMTMASTKYAIHEDKSSCYKLYVCVATSKPQCMLDNTEKQSCGPAKVRKHLCLASGCCWRPTNDYNTPWCFSPKGKLVCVLTCI